MVGCHSIILLEGGMDHGKLQKSTIGKLVLDFILEFLLTIKEKIGALPRMTNEVEHENKPMKG